MSYRAFKRLLGETSLERKCRFLFGAFILLLLTSSYWLYAWQTEQLAYDQLTTTCRPLAPSAQPPDEDKKATEKALDEFRQNWGHGLPGGLNEYSISKIT